MRTAALWIVSVSLVFATAERGFAQADSARASARQESTKLESFRPSDDNLWFTGYETVGSSSLVSVTALDIRDRRGSRVGGLYISVEDLLQRRSESAFVDQDEIPTLLEALGGLLVANENPTPLQSYRVQYSTRGGLQVSVAHEKDRAPRYSVTAGRIAPVTRTDLNEKDIRKLRELIEQALAKVSSERQP